MKNLFKIILMSLCMSSLLNAMHITGADELGRHAGKEAVSDLGKTVEKALRGYRMGDVEYDGIFDVTERVADRITDVAVRVTDRMAIAIAGKPLAPVAQAPQPSAAAAASEEKANAQPAAAQPAVAAAQPEQYPHKPLAHGISEVGKQIGDGLKNHKMDFNFKIDTETAIRLCGACLEPVGFCICGFGTSSLAPCIGCAAIVGGAAAITKPALVNNLILQAPGAAQKGVDYVHDHGPARLCLYMNKLGLKKNN